MPGLVDRGKGLRHAAAVDSNRREVCALRIVNIHGRRNRLFHSVDLGIAEDAHDGGVPLLPPTMSCRSLPQACSPKRRAASSLIRDIAAGIRIGIRRKERI